ncbi:hypothetical protein AB0A05_07315 [Streptomyces sp. NPDC046374]|uniref:hypothetical protein n=1 Tax=Streptomyces sp. NPDC046374 TaxID=3154917 RepID=UPI0033D548D5
MPYPQPHEDCYEECKEAQPAGFGGVPRCICEQINAEIDAYYAEPPEMFAREWGCY